MERGGSAGREQDKEEVQGAQLNVVFYERAHPNHRVVEFHLVREISPAGSEVLAFFVTVPDKNS